MRDGLAAAAADVQGVCEAAGLPFCFIGGLAVLRWGEPRLTRDVDLTVLAGWGNEGAVTAKLLETYESRVADPVAFASANRVALLRSGNGTPIDVALGSLPFEERSIRRATDFLLSGEQLRVCSAEDLVVHKVFAGREHDWSDVEGILARQASLEVDQIILELEPLLAAKDDATSMPRLVMLLSGR